MNGIILCTSVNENGDILALTRIGGISLLERQARILGQHGVREIIVVAGQDDDRLVKQCNRLSALGMKITIRKAAPNESLVEAFSDTGDEYFYLCDGVSLYDYTMPSTIAPDKKPTVALVPSSSLAADNADGGLRIKGESRSWYFAGIALLPVSECKNIIPSEGSGWLGEYLERFIEKSPDAILNLSRLSQYDYDMRRDESCLWMPIRSKHDNAKAKRALLNRAQKSVLDWPAWFIHRPIEKAIGYYLCELPITPNQITLFNIAVAFAGIWAFAVGHPLVGLILALLSGIIDGLDGKQARVKVMMTKIGKFEELSDRIYEYGWYAAIAFWLVGTGQYGQIPYHLFAALFILHGMDVLIGYIFKLKRGVQLDDFGPLERNFRMIGSRRNTNMWIMIPFVLFSALYPWLWTITIYYALTVLFRFWRLGRNLSQDSKRIL